MPASSHSIILHIWDRNDVLLESKQIKDTSHETSTQTWFSVPVPNIGEKIILGNGRRQDAGVVFSISHCYDSPDISATHVDAYQVAWP